MSAPGYEYEGPEALQAAVHDALTQVVDPEVAMHIVDVGLVYRVEVPAAPQPVQVRMTMTTAACPVADVILDELLDVPEESDLWHAKVKVLQENIEHHIEEEEGEMFKIARKVLEPEQLEDLGEKMAAVKEASKA